MKNLKNYLLGCLALMISGIATAQTATADEIALIQDVWGMNKKEIVREYMQFEMHESAEFWPVYEDYMDRRKQLGAERIRIINDYANTYENINDEVAKNLTKRIFDNNIELEKLHQKYYKKFSKVIGARQASKFMQIEKYMDTIVRMEIQDQIPFIDELEDLRVN